MTSIKTLKEKEKNNGKICRARFEKNLTSF